MSTSELVQIEVAQPLLPTVAALRADVRPLRALFEDLSLEVRRVLHAKGITDPELVATLDLRYADQPDELTVCLPLEIENGAICMADPLPLDAQALREALADFHAAYAQRFGDSRREATVQAVRLRVTGHGVATAPARD